MNACWATLTVARGLTRLSADGALLHNREVVVKTRMFISFTLVMALVIMLAVQPSRAMPTGAQGPELPDIPGPEAGQQPGPGFGDPAYGLGAPTAGQQAGQNVELVGQIGGATYVVDVQGNYAYIGVGQEFTVLRGCSRRRRLRELRLRRGWQIGPVDGGRHQPGRTEQSWFLRYTGLGAGCLCHRELRLHS